MQILPRCVPFLQSDIYFHFHNTTFTLTIASITFSNLFQDVSSSKIYLSDEDTEYQCSRSGDSSVSDDTDRSIGIIRYRRITRPRALRQNLRVLESVFHLYSHKEH